MILKQLCPPAFIYLIFSLSQIIIDAVKGYFNTALVKVFTTFIFTYLLNFLCNAGLGIISWIIVFIPFILMTIISVLLLGLLGLHPKTGRISDHKQEKQHHHNHSHTQSQKPKSTPPLIQDNGAKNNQPPHHHSHTHTEDRLVFGVDKKEKEKEEEVDYDKLAIQKGKVKKDSNKDYRWFSRLYKNNKFGKRREYVKIVRNILIDMNEGDEAASFQNQSENCIERKSDDQFETCLKILCMDISEKLGGVKKKVFIKKLKSRNII